MMRNWMRSMVGTLLVLGAAMALGAGCSKGGGPIACGDQTCDGAEQYCETDTVDALAGGGSQGCQDLPSDYDTESCDGLCAAGDSTIDCHCDDNGCSVTCQAP